MNNPIKHTAKLFRQRSEIWKQIREIPGVSGLGIGLKEISGRQTGQLAWRIYVRKKLDNALLSPKNRIPEVMYGLPTDIIQKLHTRPAYGQDTVEVLRPGVQIGSDAGSSGTLGCFAIRKGESDKIVILSNSHVIYSDSASLGMTSNPDIGQPKVSCSWCCKCKVIGNARREDADNAFGPWVNISVDGFEDQRGVATDCAIADFNKKRNYTNNIENVGMITGTPPAGNLGLSAGDSVEMVGSTSGYVKGKVLSFTFNARIVDGPVISDLLFPLAVQGNSVNENFAGVFPNINQFLFIPEPDPDDPDRKMYFARPGDSGSVIVNAEKQVVALLSRAWNVDSDSVAFLNAHLSSPLPAHVGSMGIANPIHKVLDHLNIEIPDNLEGTKTSSGAMITVPSSRGSETVDADLWLSQKADELEAEIKTHPLGRQMAAKIDQHRPEVFHLVNTVRPVTVTWRRCQGPAFIAHCLKSLREPNHTIPLEIEGISRDMLIKRMANILKEHGSEALSCDIDMGYPLVIHYINQVNTVQELLELLKSLNVYHIRNQQGHKNLLLEN